VLTAGSQFDLTTAKAQDLDDVAEGLQYQIEEAEK
jgi:hypothetical protein